MINTSLCYIQKNDSYLMIHRNKKKNDYNKDKWIGIGGKFLEAESPHECVCREVFEETGIKLNPCKIEYRGIITFVCKEKGEIYSEFMHLFWADFNMNNERANTEVDVQMESERADTNQPVSVFLPECEEGDLEWVPVSKMNELPHWKGDEIFLDLLAKKPTPAFFSLKLEYEEGVLLKATLDGKVLDL